MYTDEFQKILMETTPEEKAAILREVLEESGIPYVLNQGGFEFPDKLFDVYVEDIMLTENMKLWLQQMYRNEAKEQRGTAENCHIFALGSDTQEDAEQFEQFAEEHREFADILEAMADELDEDPNSNKSQYPCDYLSDCPYNATGGYDCRNFCGLGVDE